VKPSGLFPMISAEETGGSNALWWREMNLGMLRNEVQSRLRPGTKIELFSKIGDDPRRRSSAVPEEA
jgi:hypothetical protein